MDDFLQKDIRYVAIADNIDTEKGLDDLLPMRDLFNEFQAKDISKKIKAVFSSKARRGERLGGKPPYGCLPKGKGFTVDEEIAPVIRQQLTGRAGVLEAELAEQGAKAANVGKFLAVVRRYTNIQELNPTVLREFVDKIVVHEPDRSHCKRTQKIDIHYNFVGDLE